MPEYSLLVVFLTVASSYSSNIEHPPDGVSDTVQFWFTPEQDWRIRTFAVDHDIHVHVIRECPCERKFGIDQAIHSTSNHYADIIDRHVLISLNDPADATEVTGALASHGLSGTIEQSRSGLAFYNPDQARYWSQSVHE